MAILSSLWCISIAYSQSNAHDAALYGYVHDPSGAVIPDAKIEVRDLATNIGTEAITNDDGYYHFPLLRVGIYEVTAIASSFKEYIQSTYKQA